MHAPRTTGYFRLIHSYSLRVAHEGRFPNENGLFFASPILR